MRELFVAGGIGVSASIAQVIQALPSDPTEWGNTAEKLGVIGILALVIAGLLWVIKLGWSKYQSEIERLNKEHKDELNKKDAHITSLENKIDRLEERLDRQMVELAETKALLRSTVNQVDVSETTKRKALELNSNG